ncbi:MAG: ATP-binding protein, partial [Bacteroidota bacterium]
MAHQITIPFLAVKLHLSTKDVVLSPLMESNTISLNETTMALAGRYAEKFQRLILNQGEFHRIVQLYPGGNFYKASTSVSFKAHKEGRYPEFSLEFDYYFRPSDQGTWGMVPALGLESFAQGDHDIEQQIQELIYIDFMRNRRLESLHNVISTIWYEAVELQSHEVTVRFPKLTELENIAEGEQDKLLPTVAQKLDVNRREVYGRKTEMDHLAKAVRTQFSKCVLLVGPSGVGKTALVWELVRQRSRRKIKAEIWETTASTMIKELTRETGWQDNLAFLCTELAQSTDFL